MVNPNQLEKVLVAHKKTLEQITIAAGDAVPGDNAYVKLQNLLADATTFAAALEKLILKARIAEIEAAIAKANAERDALQDQLDNMTKP